MANLNWELGNKDKNILGNRGTQRDQKADKKLGNTCKLKGEGANKGFQ